MLLFFRWIVVLAATLAHTSPSVADDETLPFNLPVPEGWRTETLFFPLEFAPSLPYTGLEELRFAPGMFEEGHEEFWSYAFVWWVEKSTSADDHPVDPDSLATHLEAYFRGLMAAVAESRDLDVGDAPCRVALVPDQAGTFQGTAQTLDAFVTGRPIRLNVRAQIRDCDVQGHRAVLFALSPQVDTHPVWQKLCWIREGFECDRESP